MSHGLPAGIPLGRWLTLPPGIAHDDLREAIGAIERVHGDGMLTEVPVRLTIGFADRGRFHFDPDHGHPVAIVIRADQADRQLSLVHEVGHFLDLCALGRAGVFGTSTNETLADWHQAARASHAHNALVQVVSTGEALVQRPDGSIGPTRLRPQELVALRRWLEPDEMWARTYAQYIATRSEHPPLLASLERLRTRPIGKVYYPRQWDDDDFVSIGLALDQVMEALAWRT